MLTVQNRKARGNVRYAISKTPKSVEWSSKNMFVLGIVILAFLVVHLIQFWAKMQLVEILGDHGTVPLRQVRSSSRWLSLRFGLRLSTSSVSSLSGSTSTMVSGRCSSLSAGITMSGFPLEESGLRMGFACGALLHRTGYRLHRKSQRKLLHQERGSPRTIQGYGMAYDGEGFRS